MYFKLRDTVRSTEIRKITKAKDALYISQNLKGRWAGHVARYADNRWTIDTINGKDRLA